MLRLRCLPFAVAAVVLLTAASAGAEVVVFRGFTLIDGRGGAPLPSAGMVVDDGRIRQIGRAADLQVPGGAEIVDLAGRFVMPGIVNLHGHLGNVRGLTQDSTFFTREHVESQLATYAAYGVTSVVTMGTEQALVFDLRAAQRSSRPRVARVFTAFRGLTNAGGYPTNLAGLKGVPFEVTTREDVRRAVAELASRGADLVKMWVEDHLGLERTPKFSRELMTAVVEESRRAEMKPVAHVFYLEDARHLAHAGAAGFVHGVRDRPVDDDLIDAMRKGNVWQAASTLSRELSMFAYADRPAFLDEPFFRRAMSEDAARTLKSPDYRKRVMGEPLYSRYPEFFETAKRNLKRLADAGVRYGLGTDSGPPARFQGAFEHLEMELMVEAGLTPLQVITAATRNGAEFLGVLPDLGTLEPGKWADLLVLRANPLDDIRNTRTLETVYIAGQRVVR